MKKLILLIITFCIIVGVWFLYSEIHSAEAQHVDTVTFSIEDGESVSVLANRLEEEHVIRHAWLFKKYIVWKGIDREIRQGSFSVSSPITLARVVESLENPSVGERTITIIPGWGLRDIAEYFENEGIASSTAFYEVVGLPAHNYKAAGESAPQPFDDIVVLQDKLNYFGLEGYLSPDTFRVFKNASVSDIILK